MNVLVKKASMFVMAMIALTLTASIPRNNSAILDSCDYVEINHVYYFNEVGEHELRMIQYIWWEWRDRVLLPVLDPVNKKQTGNWKQGSAFIVREYLVVYSGNSRPNGINSVLLSKNGNKWVCVFYKKEDKIIRTVICNWLIKTHTSYDVEIKNRDIVRISDRNKFQKR